MEEAVKGAKNLPTPQLRHVFDVVAQVCVKSLEAECLGDFLKSTNYNYVLQLLAKQGVTPAMDHFKAVRVLGQDAEAAGGGAQDGEPDGARRLAEGDDGREGEGQRLRRPRRLGLHVVRRDHAGVRRERRELRLAALRGMGGGRIAVTTNRSDDYIFSRLAACL